MMSGLRAFSVRCGAVTNQRCRLSKRCTVDNMSNYCMYVLYVLHAPKLIELYSSELLNCIHFYLLDSFLYLLNDSRLMNAKKAWRHLACFKHKSICIIPACHVVIEIEMWSFLDSLC